MLIISLLLLDVLSIRQCRNLQSKMPRQYIKHSGLKVVRKRELSAKIRGTLFNWFIVTIDIKEIPVYSLFFARYKLGEINSSSDDCRLFLVCYWETSLSFLSRKLFNVLLCVTNNKHLLGTKLVFVALHVTHLTF